MSGSVCGEVYSVRKAAERHLCAKGAQILRSHKCERRKTVQHAAPFLPLGGYLVRGFATHILRPAGRK